MNQSFVEIYNDKYTDDQYLEFIDSFNTNPTIHTLHMYGVTGNRLIHFAQSLIDNTTLKSLKCDTDCGPLLTALEFNSTLEHLMLKVIGTKRISNILKTNTTLLTLMLTGRSLDMRPLADALKVNTTLETLGLEATNICDGGAIALSEALAINNSLRVLNLNQNNISDRGAQALLEVLKTNTTLQTLNLWNTFYVNPISKKLTDEMRGYIVRNRTWASGECDTKPARLI